MQVHVYLGMRLMIGAKNTGESCQHSRSDESNIERTHFATANTSRLVDIVLHVEKRAAGTLKKCLACWCETHGTSSPIEQRCPDNFFKLTNLL